MRYKIVAPIIFTFILLNPRYLTAQNFTEITTTIPNLLGSSDWGDFDSDGDLDLLVGGTNVPYPFNTNTYICVNNGNGQFTKTVVSNLPAIYDGTVRWLDYNKDGILDIFISGLYYDALWQNYMPTTKLFKGTGNRTFEETGNLFDVSQKTAVAWADFNNDGTSDIILDGYTEMYPWYHGRVYENINNAFVESSKFHIQPLINGSLQWGDYDGDQDLDLIQTGSYLNADQTQEIPATYLYRNDCDSFALLKNTGIKGLVFGSTEWGDYDNDGDLDLLQSGQVGYGSGATGYFKVYKNNGNGNFEMISVEGASTRVYRLSKWGDFDNDGDLDVIISGSYQASASGFTYLYINNDGLFTKAETLCDVIASSINCVDYDNDGDLDIFLTGSSNYETKSKLFRNNTATHNAPPNAPAGLSVSVNRKKVHFSWSPPEDDHTGKKSLTYNLSVGTLPANSEIMEPVSFLSNGFRKLVKTGNTSIDTCWDLTFRDFSKYYWQVQAIDNSFAGSQFSEIRSFTLGELTVSTELVSDVNFTDAVLNGKVKPYESEASVYFEYGTDTNNLLTTPATLYQGDSLFSVTDHIQNLLQDTIYYYRIKAFNNTDTVAGQFVHFRTASDGIVERFQKINVYPNPSTGLLRIDIPDVADCEVSIFDNMGRKRLQLCPEDIFNSNIIDIKYLETGIYTLVVDKGKYTYRCRIEKL